MPIRVRKAMLGVGAAALLLLLMTTIYNDLARLGILTQ